MSKLLIELGLASGGIAAILGLIAKFLPPLIGKQVLSELNRAFASIKDEDDRALGLALLKWLDAKLGGLTPQKAQIWAHWACARVKLLAGQEDNLASLVQELDEQLRQDVEQEEANPARPAAAPAPAAVPAAAPAPAPAATPNPAPAAPPKP